MKFPRFYWYEWVMILCAFSIIIFLLTGCVQRAAVIDQHTTSPGFILIKLSLVATALAGTGLIASGFLALFYPDKAQVAKFAGVCLATIGISQAVYWLGSHPWIMGVAIVGTVGLWCWSHYRLIEKWLGKDLNGDKKIG